ncbi:peptidylprolyl isomerase [uncultured Microscilla sp.]|uniref:peptidylprolyl isomerase n=1 Tax=uncultured Microscilla sp. TaxID=432653 RepID=UPI00260475DA|nr:peptidylprolyl isomerase [uncultured Microscilla sp.]
MFKNSVCTKAGLYVLGLCVALVSCTTTKKTTSSKSKVIATLGANPIYLSDFKYTYEKSLKNKDSAYTRSSVSSYLDLYIKFKLKILAAQKKGIDTTDAFNNELNTYKEQLAKPYLTDKAKVEELVREAYDRLKEEVRVSHILVKVDKEAEPQDTVVAYNKILELRKSVLNGKSFEQVASTHSQSPSAKQGGNIGYFTALQMVYPFENASYQTQVGSISDLLRTKFGYHFLKVTDRRKASGKIQTAHIMIMQPAKANAKDSLEAKRKIDKIYERLKAGEDWDKLCRQFSEDQPSKNKGGVLPEFGVGEAIPEFEQASFQLKEVGDFSKPVYTPYSGWHIIKLMKKRTLDSFTEVEPFIRQKVAKDSRLKVTHQSFIAKLKKINNFKLNSKVANKAIAKADATLLKGVWKYSPTQSGLKEGLISFEDKVLKMKKTYTVKDFFDYVVLKQVPKSNIATPTHYMRLLLDNYIDYSALDFERNNLDAKYKDYRMLVKEYKEGMMLFQMMNDKVWNKAIMDTAGARKFFEANREKYRWGKRAKATIYSVANAQVMAQLKTRLAQPSYLVSKVKVNNVYFDKEQKVLDQNAQRTLLSVANLMKKNRHYKLELSGHIDPAEPVGLSSQRLQNTLDFLLRQRIGVDRITTKDYKNSKPVSIKDRRRNRRIEFAFYSSQKKDLVNELNLTNPLNVKVSQGVYEKGDNDFVDKVVWEKGKTELQDKDRLVLVVIEDVLQPRLKTYKETRGKVIANYQTYLEKEWLESLKKEYPVQVNQEVIDQLVSKK